MSMTDTSCHFVSTTQYNAMHLMRPITIPITILIFFRLWHINFFFHLGLATLNQIRRQRRSIQYAKFLHVRMMIG